MRQEELQGARHVGIDGRRAERNGFLAAGILVVPLQHTLQNLRRLRYGKLLHILDATLALEPKCTDGDIRFCQHLTQEARHLMPTGTYAILVVDAGKMFRSLDEPVEIIREDGYTMARGGKTECLADISRYHGVALRVAWQHTFLD